MENLYTFGKEKYIPADELKRSHLKTFKNIGIVVLTAVKCTIFGIFISIKSLLQFCMPLKPKDIRNQVALVRSNNFILISFNLCVIHLIW